ncbi:FAD-binding protein [Alkalihalobacillus oceani]|uniref:FAD-binding protein n=1 Tax=Halalkalibacter oceani TaxID=1653776 RepID=A0A9X2DT62_9BACI|nr:FAD-binding protein [Halalkalibacter oceani]MCM3716504.1 FAD-binding protein [Halalkalibacter oceani]
MTLQDHLYSELKTDVLVIGGGGAALRAALAADERGAEVLVAVKGRAAKSGASYYSVAEVGIYNVPDGAVDPDDSPDVYLQDILDGALGMADPRLSTVLVNNAEQSMKYLEKLGVKYERENDRYLAFQGCFSSKPRSHVIKDHFKPIVKALGEEATRRKIRVENRLMITNLIVRSGKCYGAYAIDQEGNSVVIRAKATILGVGGASQLFEKNLYPGDITGDGYAMAYRAGAQLVNMEFMQAGISVTSPFINLFASYMWQGYPNLTNRNGDSFIEKNLENDITLDDVLNTKARHFPFSTRDISRYIEISVQKEINRGNGTENNGVYLDYRDSHFESILENKKSDIGKMWPIAYEWYEKRNIDLYKDKIEIACSAHAINGGLRISEKAQSNIQGLFAAGEVAGGPHGADRLGGNMSVTCQVFGKIAGESAAEYAKDYTDDKLADLYQEERVYLHQFQGKGSLTPGDLKKRLQRASDRHLLIIRHEEGLRRYINEVKDIRDLLTNEARIKDRHDLQRALELSNLLDVGEVMATAALLRKESRGSHYREDFPQLDQSWNKNIILDNTKPDGYVLKKLEEL